MAKKVNTIFISDDAVNLVVVEGRRVKKWASLPLEPGLVSQGLIVDEARVADDLGKLFKLVKERAGKVIAGVSGLNSLYRLISLPELPEAILPEAVKQEARRVIPVPLEEVYVSYQRLPSPPGETRLFLAAFPCNVADALIRTLREAGIEPYIMDLAPLALSRTLDEPRAIIVNVRLDNLDIIVMVDRLPQLIRTLSLPGEAASLSERLPAITEEIDRTIAFYNSSHKEEPLNSTVPMFVCGDLAQAPESWQSLTGKVNCPVSILPSPVESPDSFNPSEFMVNIGLAFKELFPEKAETNVSLVNFNVLPEAYLPKAVPLSAILAPIGIIIGIGLLVYMGFTLRNTMAYNSVLSSELAAIETRIAQEQEEMLTLKAQVTQLEAQIGPAEARTNIFETTFTSLGEDRKQLNRDMSELVSLLPKGVDLQKVNHGGASVTINGIAPAEGDIFQYARNLKGSFSSVIISSIKAREGDEGEIEGFEFELLLD
ncbi:MAG: pilus assembly protein PilM [Dehalococcoidia bacterium]|nr:pilus assembly protein PilM [Dehalococcoidia bacterium]